jgi:hypothetical protein
MPRSYPPADPRILRVHSTVQPLAPMSERPVSAPSATPSLTAGNRVVPPKAVRRRPGGLAAPRSPAVSGRRVLGRTAPGTMAQAGASRSPLSRLLPRVSGSVISASIIINRPETPNTAIALPKPQRSARMPTRAGNKAPMPRPFSLTNRILRSASHSSSETTLCGRTRFSTCRWPDSPYP